MRKAASDLRAAVLGALAAVSLIFSILSVTNLIVEGFQIGLAAPLKLVFVEYEELLQALLGWVEPIIKRGLAYLSEVFQTELTLSPFWKHTFVLVWLCLISDVRVNWAIGRRSFSAFTAVLGLVIALVFTAPSIEDGGGFGLSAGTLAMWGFVVFELIRSLVTATFGLSTPTLNSEDKGFGEVFRYCFLVYVFPLVVVAVPIQLLYLSEIPCDSRESIGILYLLSFVGAVSLVWLARGFYRAVSSEASGGNWFGRFRASTSVQAAILIITSLLGALLFVITNAGLRTTP